MNIGRLVSGIIVIVLGALTLVDGILGVVPDVETVFFTDVNPYFKIIVGFVVLIIGGTIIEKSEKD